MRMLALDTAGSACSVAACIDAGTVAARHEQLGVGQAERIVPMLAEVIDEAGWSWAGVELIVPTLGPGTFTGIRAGLAAARGLALAADRPALGVSSLEAMAAAAEAPGPLLCLLRGRGETVFAQRFAADGAPAGPAAALPLPEALALAVAGDRIVVDRPLAIVGEAIRVEIDAAAAARAARRRLASGEAPVAGHALHPLYLRDPGARRDAGRPLVERGDRAC
jgi:tRNA threonylcarbamoyladenosine biosynthesis protein TsaB